MFDPYEEWKKEVIIWENVTTLEKKTQGCALVLSLSGNARKAARNIPIEDLKKDNGVELVLKELDKYYAKDQGRKQMKAFDNFINFRRTKGMTIQDFLLQFECNANQCETHAMKIPDNILAHSLLACANLPQDKKDLISSTLTSFTFNNVREQMLKIFPTGETGFAPCVSTDKATSDDLSNDSSFKPIETFDESSIKQEPVYHNTSEEAYYSGSSETFFKKSGRGRGNRYRGKPRFESRDTRHFKRPAKLNPLDRWGKPTKCECCKSICHWVKDCPDADDGDWHDRNDESTHSRNRSDL